MYVSQSKYLNKINIRTGNGHYIYIYSQKELKLNDGDKRHSSKVVNVDN